MVMRQRSETARITAEEIDPEGHATDIFSQWAMDYIESQKESAKPFLLLMPNYVSGKPYYKALQKKSHAINDINYLYPFKRYVYWTPVGLRSKTQNHASALGNRTSPFVSFWYVFLSSFFVCLSRRSHRV